MSHVAPSPDLGTDRILRVTIVHDEGRALIVLAGQADPRTHRTLDLELAAARLAEASSVVLDLEQLSFTDVATVRRLALLGRLVMRSGRPFATRGASRMVRTIATAIAADSDLAFVE